MSTTTVNREDSEKIKELENIIQQQKIEILQLKTQLKTQFPLIAESENNLKKVEPGNPVPFQKLPTNKALALQWTFDTAKLSQDEQISLIIDIFADLQLKFTINPLKFSAFLQQVVLHYNAHAYHNFLHGVDVMFAMYYIIYNTKLKETLENLEIFALLLAALCHDLNHPGLTNDYLVKMKTDLAITYYDKSPLENHHISLTFRLLLQEPYNILEGCPSDQFNIIREIMINAILHTDHKTHHKPLVKLLAKNENNKPGEIKDLLLKILLHAVNIVLVVF